MKRYYVKITFLPGLRDDATLIGRCIQVLHGFSSRTDIQSIGVSFPCWSNAEIGSEIAFVSTSAELLSILIKQQYFKEMTQRSFFSISDIFPVPESTPEVMYVRNQRVASLFPGKLKREIRRAKRRAQQRGEVYVPINLKMPNDIAKIHFHQIPIYSKSKGKNYYLYVQKISEEPHITCDSFNSYGLSGIVEHRTPVPVTI